MGGLESRARQAMLGSKTRLGWIELRKLTD